MVLPPNTDLGNSPQSTFIDTVTWATFIAFLFPLCSAHLRVRLNYAGLSFPAFFFVLTLVAHTLKTVLFSLDL